MTIKTLPEVSSHHRRGRSPHASWRRLRGRVAVVVLAMVATTLSCAHDVIDDDHIRPSAKRQLEEDTARRRRLPFLRDVPADVFDDDDTRAFVLNMAPSPESDRLFTRINQKLGIQPDGIAYGEVQADFLSSGVAAIYLPSDGGRMAVFQNPLLESAALLNLPIDVVTGRSSVYGLVVSHEYVHALQDQHFGLNNLVPGSLYRDDEDRALARKSLIESEANMVSYAHAYGFDLERLLQRKAMVGLLSANGLLSDVVQGMLLKDVPSFWVELTTRQYDAALHFIDEAMDRGGFAALDAVYASGGPSSTEQLLWPEKYFDERDEPEALTKDVGIAGVAPDALVHASTFGELQWRVLLSLTVGASEGLRAAKGSDGDRYELWDLGERTLLTFRTAWDSDDDAKEFMHALRRVVTDTRYPRRTTVVDDSDDRVSWRVAAKGDDGEGVRNNVEEEVVIVRHGHHVVFVDGALPTTGGGIADALLENMRVARDTPAPPLDLPIPVALPPVSASSPLRDQVALRSRTLELSVAGGVTLEGDVLSIPLLPSLSMRWGFRPGFEFSFPLLLTTSVPTPDPLSLAVTFGVTGLGPLDEALPLRLLTVPRRFGFAVTEQTRAFDLFALTLQLSSEAVVNNDLTDPFSLRIKGGGALSTVLFKRLVIQAGAATETSTNIHFAAQRPTLILGSALDRAFRPMPMLELRVWGAIHLIMTSRFVLSTTRFALKQQTHEMGVLVRF